MLLGILTVTAAAQLGRSTIVDDWSLLSYEDREIDPQVQLEHLRRSAPAGLAAGPPGSEAYARALLKRAGLPLPPRAR